MGNNQQSSVELFAKTLAEQGLLVTRDYENLVAYQQAKAMHKKEIMTTYKDGRLCIKPLEIPLEDEYYNSTFGGNNEQQ